MTDNMIECKKDSLRQCQDGITKVGFTIQHDDIPDYLAAAALGKRYYLVLIDADYYDENNPTVKEKLTVQNDKELSINEKSVGERLMQRACILCKDKEFERYLCGCIYITDKDDIYDCCKKFIYKQCDIDSRAELTTNKEAQEKFKELDEKFKDWKFKNNYDDNLSREY